VFYAEFSMRVYRARTSNHFVRFANHFDQYLNSIFVRSIGYDQIIWC
jgi:hypothetical protein